MILHVNTHCQTLKKSDIVLDVNGTNFEAAICINDWVYELKIGTPDNDQLLAGCLMSQMSLA